MSVVVELPPVALELGSTRKRTTSFSFPENRPSKSPRTTMAASPLRRSESMLFLPTPQFNLATAPNNVLNPNAPLPYHRTLSYYKEQRMRRKKPPSPADQLTVRTVALTPTTPSSALPLLLQSQPQSITKPRSSIAKPPHSIATTKRSPPTPRGPPAQIILPSPSKPVTTLLTPRSSSPLSPKRFTLPGRPVFPRSKPEPDLYRTAIKMRILATPEGQRFLSLGPRLAMEVLKTTKDIVTVTEDLERMVEDIESSCCDVVMADPLPLAVPSVSTTCTTPITNQISPTPAPPILTTTWVVVKGDDWEMVDCS
jgi:hypothetical protein